MMVSECKYVNFDEKRNTKCLKAIENEDSVDKGRYAPMFLVQLEESLECFSWFLCYLA